MSKHDFNWPENFPGGLKGLVKMALKEAQDLIADGIERDDSKSTAVEQGMLSCIRPHLNVVVNSPSPWVVHSPVRAEVRGLSTVRAEVRVTNNLFASQR